MGLNMNYTLLTGEHSSRYHIPEYSNKASLNVCSESFMIQALSDFTQEIRESNNMLSEICNAEKLNEDGNNILSEIYLGIVAAINKVINGLTRIKDVIMGAINFIIDKIKDFISNKKDKLEEKHSFFERESMLQKALSHTEKEDKTVNIVDIKPSTELLNMKFPDTSILSDNRLHSDIEDLCTIEKNTRVYKDGMGTDALDPEKVHVETLVKAIEDDKEKLLSATFGNYQFDVTNVAGSANSVAEEAFGKNEYHDVELSRELYGQACDNIDNLTKLMDDLKALQKDYNKEYNTITNNLTSLQNGINKTLSNQNATLNTPLKKSYYETANQISSSLQRGLNVIRSITSANYILFMHKTKRLSAIIVSSSKIKNLAHKLICKDLKIEADTNDEKYKNDNIFNGDDTVQEFFTIQDDFNTTISLINEAMLEENFSDQLYSIIHEEEQAQPENNNQPAAAAEPASTTGDTTNKTPAANNVLTWLNNIIGKLGDTFSRFKNRIDELIIKNGPDKEWWNKNKEKIKLLNLSDTKANDWYKFNFDALGKTDSFIGEFDINQEYMKSDEAMQDAIIKKIVANPPQFNEKDTFAQKINKIYQGGDPVSDKNSDGQTLQSLGYDHKKACDYIDGMINNGFASPYLGTVSKDYKTLSDQRKKVNTDYSKYSEELKAKTATAPAEEKKEEPANASAIEYDDFRFNLAEHFALVHHEASFVVGQQSAQSAADNGAGDKSNGNNKELDAMIKRYFNYNTIAITARMTSAVSAYKQYMSLIKAVYKKPAPTTNKEENNKTNNQNTQEQQAKPEENKQ